MKDRDLYSALYDRALEVLSDAEKKENGETVYTHVPTGLAPIDNVFGGLEIGVNTLVVGHTGDGKSALLGQLAKGAAQAGYGVLWFSIEDPERRTADRSFAPELGIASHKIARLDLPPVETMKPRFQAALKNMKWAKNVRLITGDLGPEEILETVRETETVGPNKAPLKLVIVDYAQALAYQDSLEEVCSATCRGLHQAAGDKNIATVFGSQVNTKVLERGRVRWDKNEEVDAYRPGKGDAMWSQRLMQYSKAVWTIFRPGRWMKELSGAGKDDVFELNIVKANFGPEGRVVLHWDGPTTSITAKAA